MDLNNKIETFSREIMNAMDFSEEDVKEAEDLDLNWDIGSYIIYPANRAWNDWKQMLEVLPKDVFSSTNGSGVGWNNISHSPLPSDWTYIPKGTGTKILPSIDCQKEIVELIKSFKGIILN